MSSLCIKCGGTGTLISGEVCDCGCKDNIVLPTCLSVPRQYQGIRFDGSLVPEKLRKISYGNFMDKLLIECTQHLDTFTKNVLICSPPNSGKTVFAYTVYGILFAKGCNVPNLMDIMEVRDIMLNYYNTADKDTLYLLDKGKIIFIKIPQDLPNKFAETMSTIIERRVRNNCSTIFLFSGSINDILAQDTFGKFKALIGDGSFNSLEVKSWTVRQEGD